MTETPQQGTPPEGWIEGEQMPGKGTWYEDSQGPFPDNLNADEYVIIPASE